jgi:hypothetical protein
VVSPRRDYAVTCAYGYRYDDRCTPLVVEASDGRAVEAADGGEQRADVIVTLCAGMSALF